MKKIIEVVNEEEVEQRINIISTEEAERLSDSKQTKKRVLLLK